MLKWYLPSCQQEISFWECCVYQNTEIRSVEQLSCAIPIPSTYFVAFVRELTIKRSVRLGKLNAKRTARETFYRLND